MTPKLVWLALSVGFFLREIGSLSPFLQFFFFFFLQASLSSLYLLKPMSKILLSCEGWDDCSFSKDRGDLQMEGQAARCPFLSSTFQY